MSELKGASCPQSSGSWVSSLILGPPALPHAFHHALALTNASD